VEDKKFADKYFCGNNIDGTKIPLLHKEQWHFSTANIIAAKIFADKYFTNDGR
jgi:hypothetical protein